MHLRIFHSLSSHFTVFLSKDKDKGKDKDKDKDNPNPGYLSNFLLKWK